MPWKWTSMSPSVAGILEWSSGGRCAAAACTLACPGPASGSWSRPPRARSPPAPSWPGPAPAPCWSSPSAVPAPLSPSYSKRSIILPFLLIRNVSPPAPSWWSSAARRAGPPWPGGGAAASGGGRCQLPVYECGHCLSFINGNELFQTCIPVTHYRPAWRCPGCPARWCWSRPAAPPPACWQRTARRRWRGSASASAARWPRLWTVLVSCVVLWYISDKRYLARLRHGPALEVPVLALLPLQLGLPGEAGGCPHRQQEDHCPGQHAGAGAGAGEVLWLVWVFTAWTLPRCCMDTAAVVWNSQVNSRYLDGQGAAAGVTGTFGLHSGAVWIKIPACSHADFGFYLALCRFYFSSFSWNAFLFLTLIILDFSKKTKSFWGRKSRFDSLSNFVCFKEIAQDLACIIENRIFTLNLQRLE